MTDMIERLADLKHQNRCNWMRWMFDCWDEENIARFKRLMNTPYVDLSEGEKEVSRRDVRRDLGVMREPVLDMGLAGSEVIRRHLRGPRTFESLPAALDSFEAMIDKCLKK